MEYIIRNASIAFQYYGVDWLATSCGLLGVYFLGNKNKIGFVLFMIASASWVTFGVIISSLAVIAGSSVFFLMHLRGFINWLREE